MSQRSKLRFFAGATPTERRAADLFLANLLGRPAARRPAPTVGLETDRSHSPWHSTVWKAAGARGEEDDMDDRSELASLDDPELFFAELMGVPPRRGAGAARREWAGKPVRTRGVVDALQSLRLRMERVETRARQVGGFRAKRLLDREHRRLERTLNELVERESVDDPGVLGQLVALAAPRRAVTTAPSPEPREDDDTLAESLPLQPVTLSIPTTSSDAKAFWGSVVATNARESRAGRLAFYLDGDLRYVALQPPPGMRIVRRTAEELFGTTVSRVVAAENLRVAINGNMFDVSTTGGIDVWWGHDPVPAGKTSPIGRVVVGGRVIDGRSEPDRFHVAYNVTWAAPLPAVHYHPTYRFGQGDPPTGTGGADMALGGLGPIIIGGLQYGAGNLYRTGVPAGAPVAGPVPPHYLPFLVQRNSSHYISFQGRGASVGKVAVAINRTQDILLILVQSHGGSSGMTLDSLRDKLVATGCEDAVFGDGSDSVMLVAGGMTLIAQGEDKEEATTIGLGFV